MTDANILTLWRTIVGGIVLVIFIFVTSYQLTNFQIMRAIEAGAHPIMASCAMASEKGCSPIAILNLEERIQDGRN